MGRGSKPDGRDAQVPSLKNGEYCFSLDQSLLFGFWSSTVARQDVDHRARFPRSPGPSPDQKSGKPRFSLAPPPSSDFFEPRRQSAPKLRIPHGQAQTRSGAILNVYSLRIFRPGSRASRALIDFQAKRDCVHCTAVHRIRKNGAMDAGICRPPKNLGQAGWARIDLRIGEYTGAAVTAAAARLVDPSPCPVAA